MPVDVEVSDVAVHAFRVRDWRATDRQNVTRAIKRERIVSGERRSCAMTLSWIGRRRGSSVWKGWSFLGWSDQASL